jgi:hypothetical protein
MSGEHEVDGPGSEFEIVEHEDGWAVRRGDEILSVHPQRAGAEADRFRLVEVDATDAEEADDALTEDQGAQPGNEGA